MQAEILALEANQTWVVFDLPSNKQAIGCKWVYKVKQNFDGSIKRCFKHLQQLRIGFCISWM
jgi:hypothetical protein